MPKPLASSATDALPAGAQEAATALPELPVTSQVLKLIKALEDAGHYSFINAKNEVDNGQGILTLDRAANLASLNRGPVGTADVANIEYISENNDVLETLKDV